MSDAIGPLSRAFCRVWRCPIPSSVIGQLRIILGLDTAQFEKGLDDAQRQLVRHGRQMERWGQRMEQIGQSIAVGITLPILAVGGAALKMGATFEAAMNKVQAATGATAAEFKQLRDQALAFGKDRRFTATAAETASAMENLAKNGRSIQEILGGATEATLLLASATGSELPAAADLATDVMQQFGRKAGELPGLVDKMSGAMVASKLDFDNYRLAVGQAGSVAGNLMPFEEFNTAIAATAAGFASGSDAGTSFKTFLQRLTPQSKEAAGAIAQLGLDFFDAEGKMRPIGEIAEQLRLKLGGLSQEARGDFLNRIFGSDSSRTAIELMKQGADGIARISAEVDKVSAQTQAEALMKGWAGAVIEVKKAFEAAAIALGDSGFLAGMTAVLQAVAAAIGAFASLPQPILVTIGVLAGLTAAVGPMVFIVGRAVQMWGGLVVMLAGRAVPALTATATASTAAGAAAGRAAIGFGTLRTAMAFLTGPWGVAIAGITAAIWGLSQAADNAGPATKAAAEELRRLSTQSKTTESAAQVLASSTATAADRMEAAIVQARDLAAKLYGVEAGAKAAAAALALMRLREAEARQQKVEQTDYRSWFGIMRGTPRGESRADKAARRTAAENVAAERAIYDKALAEYVEARKRGRTPPIPTPAPIPTFTPTPAPSEGGRGRSAGGGRSGPTKEELAARREEIQLQAQLDAAQTRGDEAAMQRIQDQLNHKRQIADYEEAGLSKMEARKAAESDLAAVAAARREAAQRELEDHRLANEIDIARMENNGARMVELEREQALRARILFYEQQLVEIADSKLRKETATARALEEQAKWDAARAAMRDRWLAEDQLQRELDLMRLRGDSEERIRAKERELEIQRRIAELRTSGEMTEDAARDQAEAEAEERELARRQGQWRETFRGALRAALDGNLGDFVKNWWKERIAKALENALNSVSDLLLKIFSTALGQAAGGGGGGGLFSALGNVLGSVLGGGSAGWHGGANPAGAMSIGAGGIKIPGFKTGGSFRVGGMSGIDRNLVQFRATKGEMVDIRRPGSDAGARGAITMFNDFRGAAPEAVSAINARLDMLNRSIEQRALTAVADAQDRRFL